MLHCKILLMVVAERGYVLADDSKMLTRTCRRGER
jgi:hypothetical protein